MQRNIGYVPQEIFISDEDIISNIAFGLKENIDQEKVIRAAKIANLHNFIEAWMMDIKQRLEKEEYGYQVVRDKE